MYKEIISLIKENDKTYITSQERENKCSYDFEVLEKHRLGSAKVKSLVNSWGLPEDEYYIIIGIPKNDYFNKDDSRISGYELNYIYGVRNKNLIIINHQGGTEAYRIKNNEIIETYTFKPGPSLKWR